MSDSPLIIYTCVTGGYDTELMKAPKAPNQRWVCFTDRPARIRANDWEVLPLQSPRNLRDGHRINRYHKFFSQRLFPDARWSVYLDGNLDYAGDIGELARKTKEARATLGLFMHPHGHDLHREVEVCAQSKFSRRDHSLIGSQIQHYSTPGLAFDEVIPAGYLLVRDHHACGLANAMDLWWDQINRFTGRDQISLPYVLFKTGLPWLALDRDGNINPSLITRRSHAPAPLYRRALRRLQRLWDG